MGGDFFQYANRCYDMVKFGTGSHNGSWSWRIPMSWEPKGSPPMPRGNTQEIAGLIKGLLTIGFSSKALLGSYFLGGVALGGAPLGSHEFGCGKLPQIFVRRFFVVCSVFKQGTFQRISWAPMRKWMVYCFNLLWSGETTCQLWHICNWQKNTIVSDPEVYPFSHNHGSVENHPKWKETNIGGPLFHPFHGVSFSRGLFSGANC